MLCQKCHKNLATVRYAEVVDGQVTEQHLCEECVSRQQSEAAGFELSGPPPLVRKVPAERVAREAMRTQRACPSCGMLLSHIVESGRVGCGRCYEHFGGQVESMLEALQRSLQHRGKVTHLDDARARLRGDLQSKRSLLRSMLRAENYEEAARLRDEIRGLEAGLYMSESGAD